MKHLIRFLGGGLTYFVVEIVWRYFMRHGTASPLMILMGGTVFTVVMLVEDKKLHILLGSFIGAVTAVSMELLIGSVLLYGYGIRLWHYGRINFNGIIALDWSFIWWGLCFGLILARRLLTRYFTNRKGKGKNHGKTV